ncbi:hypothetical protein SY83_12140 [Paenibacillus swuensis]|uniref:AraC family transcriptional regulator n=1 Tax=Paenibacillus swuensis TaxID=1178515 RepID=A0A172TJD3_9BACL|nr:response regulator [Paenibacillus swuensis]ANE46903.1 hypothetical protein SY83_12140 [Paenibacillus swuensis]
MYSLLVVDDAVYAVDGIADSIAWEELQISRILKAYDAFEAMSILESEAIDLLICDIEMPEKSGLELLEWMTGNKMETETIILTGHAHFQYARQVIQLGGHSYLLKPPDYDELKGIAGAALEKLRKKRESKFHGEAYGKYAGLWENQLPLLVERLWQDILSERVLFDESRMNDTFAQYGLPVSYSDPIVLVLLSLEQWRGELTSRDEQIMEFAVRNAASEVILNGLQGAVMQDGNGDNYALIYPRSETSPEALEQLISTQCRTFIDSCYELFGCQLSCYISSPVTVRGLSGAAKRLLQQERNHVNSNREVYSLSHEVPRTGNTHMEPVYSDWEMLFERGRAEELGEAVDRFFAEMGREVVHVDVLEAVYHGVLRMIYNVMHKKNMMIRRVYDAEELLEISSATRSLQALRQWVKGSVSKGITGLKEQSKPSLEVIEKAKRYMMDHLSEDFTREDVANHVYLNAAYLSRLFKREEQISLSEYIIGQRLNWAKRLLETTEMKVGHVAETVGYSHIPHFTSLFKKQIGVSPQQYRKEVKST